MVGLNCFGLTCVRYLILCLMLLFVCLDYDGCFVFALILYLFVWGLLIFTSEVTCLRLDDWDCMFTFFGFVRGCWITGFGRRVYPLCGMGGGVVFVCFKFVLIALCF